MYQSFVPGHANVLLLVSSLSSCGCKVVLVAVLL